MEFEKPCPEVELSLRIRPEIKILLYVLFVISIFLTQNLTSYVFITALIFILFLKIPFLALKRGWLPISLFLVFTFISNMFFSHGKIIVDLGFLEITEEGLHIATVRTLRIFFMVAGAKILTSTTSFDDLVKALANTLKPLEKIGIPVNEFFSTMGLTLKAFPKLKDYLVVNYKNHKDKNNTKGFMGKARILSLFLLPMFIQSMQSPEIFFDEQEDKT